MSARAPFIKFLSVCLLAQVALFSRELVAHGDHSHDLTAHGDHGDHGDHSHDGEHLAPHSVWKFGSLKPKLKSKVYVIRQPISVAGVRGKGKALQQWKLYCHIEREDLPKKSFWRRSPLVFKFSSGSGAWRESCSLGEGNHVIQLDANPDALMVSIENDDGLVLMGARALKPSGSWHLEKDIKTWRLAPKE